MPATIEPEPDASEREAILDAIADPGRASLGGWTEAALAEGVEKVDTPDP